MRDELKEWSVVQQKYLMDVTSGWFSTVEEIELYMQSLLTPGFAVDEIGMLLLCRMYRLRLRVLFHNNFWTALACDKLSACDVFLACTGRYKFSLTLKLEKHDTLVRKARKRKHQETVTTQEVAPPAVEPEANTKAKYVRKEVIVSIEDIRDIIKRSEQIKAQRELATARKERLKT